MSDNAKDEIDYAIEVVNARFAGIWDASPAMIGYARAVAKVAINAERGDFSDVSGAVPVPEEREPFRLPPQDHFRFRGYDDYVTACMVSVAHWLNTGKNLP